MRLRVRWSKKRLAGILLAASVVTSVVGQSVSRPLRDFVRLAWAPLGDAPMYVTTAFERRISPSPDLTDQDVRGLVEDNRRLRAQLLELSRAYEAYLRQDELKQYLYGRMPGFPCELIDARVVGADALPYGDGRLLSAGASSGVALQAAVTTRELLTDRAKALPHGLAVISTSALVGRIVEAGAFTARAQLLTDAGFGTPAQVFRIVDPRRPRQVKIVQPSAAAVAPLTAENNHLIPVWAQGDGKGGLVVRDVSENHNVLPGDWLITPRDDRFLPAGVRIGEVTEVTPDPRHVGVVTLRVRPHADLESLREVYVVVPLGGGSTAGRSRSKD